MRSICSKIIKYSLVVISILSIVCDVLTINIDQADYNKLYYIIIQFFSPNIIFGLFGLAVSKWHKLCAYNYVACAHIIFISIHNLFSIHKYNDKEGELYDNSYMYWISIIVLIYLLIALIFTEFKKSKNEVNMDK